MATKKNCRRGGFVALETRNAKKKSANLSDNYFLRANLRQRRVIYVTIRVLDLLAINDNVLSQTARGHFNSPIAHL